MTNDVSKDDVKDAKVRTSPIEFFSQVRTEVSKVTWPSRKETILYATMVLVMAILAMVFFFLVDLFLNWAVRLLMGIGG